MNTETLSLLTALSPLDGRYGDKTQPLRSIFSEAAFMQARAQVEIEWFIALSEAGLPEFNELSKLDKTALRSWYADFEIADAQAIKNHEKVTNHDVKAVEYWLKDKLASLPHLKNASEFIHFACTSEDINNTAHGLMLKAGRALLAAQYRRALEKLAAMAQQFASVPMLARTHGQTASPTTVGKEMANIAARLQTAIADIEAAKLPAKMNGAVGNYNAHSIAYPEIDWVAFAKNVVENRLGLQFNLLTIQIEPHDGMANLFHALCRANTILLDAARDFWGYISLGYFKQKLKDGEVGSSAMPHKVNPIDFENAEGNLGLANAVLIHLAEKLPVSRWQRDLTDSTVLRNMGVGFGYSLIALQSFDRGLSKLELNEAQLAADLDASWEVLAEAVQTVMRRYGLPQPYEQLKAFTRGKPMTAASLREFISQIDLPAAPKAQLLALTPASYTGLAASLAKSLS